MGKTRLAIEAAQFVRRAFPGGVPGEYLFAVPPLAVPGRRGRVAAVPLTLLN